MKKIIALLLACIMALGTFSVGAFAESENFIITNPYKNVDWESWDAYKAQFHCHTNASDGYLTVKEVVQKSYDLGYDVLAITDHATLNEGWNNAPELIPLLREVKKERTKNAPIYPLSEEEYNSFLNGTAPTTNGTVRKNGMIDVPKGIELNGATPVTDCHLTGYWSDYGQGLAGVYGDYETPAKGVKDAGGISMLSHVGEYVYIKKDSYNYVGKKVDDYYANKFARVFLDNKGSCVGMGINSATDEHTRCDRILYDQVLQKTIPNGVVPWGFSFSDSHNNTSLNDAYTMMMMPTLSNDALRKCMENGEFFSVSHYSNGVELNGMKEWEEHDFDEDVDAMNMNETPMVTYMSVDEQNDIIYIECENADTITWVSNGNVILRTPVKNGKATLDLHSDNLLDTPEMFVRFYITGEQGICYSQPLVIQREGETFQPVNVPKTHDLPSFLRWLVTTLDWLLFKWNPIVWVFKYFALGYNPVERFANDIVSIFR